MPQARPDSLAALIGKETGQAGGGGPLVSAVNAEAFIREHSIPVNRAVGAYDAGNTRVNLTVMPWELARSATMPEGAPPLYV